MAGLHNEFLVLCRTLEITILKGITRLLNQVQTQKTRDLEFSTVNEKFFPNLIRVCQYTEEKTTSLSTLSGVMAILMKAKKGSDTGIIS